MKSASEYWKEIFGEEPKSDNDKLICAMMSEYAKEIQQTESLGAGWVSINEGQPKTRQRVYVVCENPQDGGGVVRFQTMAEYIPYMTVKEEDYMADEYHGEGDYNEEEGEYYTPEGFYEWQSEPEMHWKISAKVTHWMPLIALP